MNRSLLLILVALVFGVHEANAQEDPLEEYVIEERGDTLVIADFFDADQTANTLGSVIGADTANVPEGRVYMLHAGTNGSLSSGNPAMYLMNSGGITEQGRPLTIVGEDCGLMVNSVNKDNPGDCRPPTISGFTDASGDGQVASISIDEDLTLKNLHFTSAHNQGEANWSFVEINGNDLTIQWENVLAEHNRWTMTNSNGNPGTSLYIKDSYFINATDQANRRNGGIYDAVSVPTDSMWVENTTHVQNQGMQYKFRNFTPAMAMFNHNTFVNSAGQVFLGHGYYTRFVATNNLFVNSNYQPYYPGMDRGEFSPSDRSAEEFQPHGIINLNPLPTNDEGEPFITISEGGTSTTESFEPSERKVLVDGNAAYWDDQLLNIANDLNEEGIEGDACEGDDCVTDDPSLDWMSQAILANERTMGMFENDDDYPLLTWGAWYQDGPPNFEDGPEMLQELYDWGYASHSDNLTNSQLLPKLRTEGNEAGKEIEEDYDLNNWITYDWPVAVNLAYDNQTYLEGGYEGFPVGDLNWFAAQGMKSDWLAQRDAEYGTIMDALENGETIVDVEEVGGTVPSTSQLRQNYPNPFSADQKTRIEFSLAEGQDVELEVYDLLGRRVATLVDKRLSAGNYTVSWDGTDASGNSLSSGTYYYRLKVGQQSVATKQMVFVK